MTHTSKYKKGMIRAWVALSIVSAIPMIFLEHKNIFRSRDETILEFFERMTFEGKITSKFPERIDAELVISDCKKQEKQQNIDLQRGDVLWIMPSLTCADLELARDNGSLGRFISYENYNPKYRELVSLWETNKIQTPDYSARFWSVSLVVAPAIIFLFLGILVAWVFRGFRHNDDQN